MGNSEEIIENIESIEAAELSSDISNLDNQREMLEQNLKQAELEGNSDAVDYYKTELEKINTEQNEKSENNESEGSDITERYSVEEKINQNKDISFGSSCEEFCQETRSNRTHGNFTRRGR